MTKACIMAASLLAFPGLVFGQAKPVSPPAGPSPSPAAATPAPAKPDAPPAKLELNDATQIAAAMEKASQFQLAKKYEEARAIYQQILTVQSKGEAVAAARWQIAQSYKAEGKLALAAPFLEAILADKLESPPAITTGAQAMLAEARMSIAAGFIKAKRYDAAIATLQQTVDDKNSSPAAVRAAMLAIARDQLAWKKPAEAIATYRLLLAKPPIGDNQRLDDIIALLALAPDSVGDLEAYIKSHPATAIANRARALRETGLAYQRLKQFDKAAAAFDAVLALKGLPFDDVRQALVDKAELTLAKGDRAGAIAIYRGLLTRPTAFYRPEFRLEDLERLIALAPNLDVTDEVAAYVNHSAHYGDINLSSAAPGNDVLSALTARYVVSAVDRYADYLRKGTGRALPSELEIVKTQLTKGGTARPFLTSQFSKELAKRISSRAFMGSYLKPLLSGDYQAAARVAWHHARLVQTTVDDRDNWINMVALAVACQDEYRGGRAASFLKWADPDAPVTAANKNVVPDALAEYLDDSPLPFHPSDKDMAAAAAQLGLNQVSPVSLLDPSRLVQRVLPDNDVLVLALHAPEAVDRYRFHLWRTTGRCTAAQLAAVAKQIKSGGSERPFVVSEQSKQLATMVGGKGWMGTYFKVLLSGDYRGAARFAWARARASNGGSIYDNWVDAVATAIRCRDQAVGQRDADFVRWTQGKLLGPDHKPVIENPEAAFLGN